MLPHPLTNFEIEKYFQDESWLSGVYSKNNLPKIKDGHTQSNLHEYKLIGSHWIALYVSVDNVVASNDATYFNSFGAEHIPKQIQKVHRK